MRNHFITALLFSFLSTSFSLGQITLPYVESFESGFGSWTNAVGDDFDWSTNTGTTPSNNTGPENAHDGTTYIYGEASNPNYPSKTCYLEATFDFTGVSNPMFEFYYHMFGSTVNSLHIDVNNGVWNTDVWVLSGEQQTATTDPFTKQTVDLSAFGNTNNITVRFRIITGTGGTGWQSDIAVDDFFVYESCGIVGGNASVSDSYLCGAGTVNLSLTGQGAGTIQWQQSLNGGPYSDIAGGTTTNYTTGTLTPTNTYGFRAKVTNGCNSYSDTTTAIVQAGSGTNTTPNTESFESGLGIWSQNSGDTHDWSRQSGGTPSNNTGPSGASDGSFYMFVEASNPNFNSISILESDFDFSTSTNPEITFDYHMFGAAMGTLFLDVNGITVWSLTGQQQAADTDPWTSVTVDLSAFAGSCLALIQFRGETGTTFTSDFSIDNIFVDDPCAVNGGNTDISNTALCSNGSVDLSLAGYTGGSTIQWQQSTNGAAYTNIIGATSANYTTGTLTSPNNYSYRAAVSNGCLSYSDTSSTTVSASGGTYFVDDAATFETGFNNWTNSSGDSHDWSRQSGGTASNNTGPSGAAGGSFYIYIEASNPNFNTTAIIEKDFDFSGSTNPEISFDYHMFGGDMGTLTLFVNGVEYWSRSGQQHASSAEAWTNATISLSDFGGACFVNLQFQGETGANFQGDMSIDNINVSEPCSINPGVTSISSTALCSNGTVDLELLGADGGTTIQWQQSVNGAAFANIVGATSSTYTSNTLTASNSYAYRARVTNGCTATSDTSSVFVNGSNGTIATFPHAESFETGFGSWNQNAGDDIDWTRQSGGTPSNNTGPSAASDGSFYLFTESSNPNFNRTAILELDFDFTGVSNPMLTFDYHMFGSDMGTFSIIVNGTTLWNLSGQQHTSNADAWTTVTIDLSTYGNACFANIQFTGLTGADYMSDIAFDNIVVDFSDLTWTGAVNTDWNNTGNWTPNFLPDNLTNVTIPDVSGASGNFPSINAGINGLSHDLTIEANANVNIATGFTLSIAGNLINNGAASFGVGTTLFSGTANQNIDGNIDFTDIIVNNTGAGVTINSGVHTLTGSLTLADGNFETGGNFTLISDASGTAMINEITNGSISGNITAQRYVDAGATNWRFMTSPVGGQTLQDWNDDLITTGFPGSDWPTWPSASNPWPNVYYYDETIGSTYDDGYVSAPNITYPLGVGQGFWFWSGDTITGTQPFLVDLTGPATTGDVDFAVTYNFASGATHDGWNLIGNPYAAPIDWDSPNWTKSNINAAIYIWNPDLQQYATYVSGVTPGTGVGTNGGSRYIASHQAFMVEASAGPVLRAHENVKAVVSEAFIKQGTPITPDVFGLNVLAPNGFQDQALMRIHSDGIVDFNKNLDAHKINSNNASVPNMSIAWNDENYAIKSFNTYNSDLAIPIMISPGVNGLHQLQFTNNSIFSGMSCVLLEDLYNDTILDLRTVTSYSALLEDTVTLPQFIIHFGKTARIETTNATCLNPLGSAEVFLNGFNDNLSYSLNWEDNNGAVLGVANSFEESYIISNLLPGTYSINMVDSTGVCGSQQTEFEILYPNQAVSSFTVDSDTLFMNGLNALSVSNNSQNCEDYIWEFGNGISTNAFEPSYIYTQAGNYLVTLVASNEDGCIDTSSATITVIPEFSGLVYNESENVFLVQDNNKLELQFHLLKPKNITLSVLDIKGQLVISKQLSNVLVDNHSLILNEPNGIYILTLQSENWSKFFKISVTR